MNAFPLQHSVTIYIHPDKGPVSPIDLDMLTLETEILGLDSYTNHDEARVMKLAERIKQAFPDVDLSGSLGALAQLARRFSHVGLFSGFVLRVPGTISGPAQPVDPTVKEFARMSAEAQDHKDELQRLHQENSALKAHIAVLEENALQWRDAHRQYQEKLDRLRLEREDAVSQLETQTRVSKINESSVTDLQREVGELQTQLEQLRRQNQSLLRLQNEVAGLRQLNENNKAENQQLRDSLEKQKQEEARLQQRIKHLEQEIASKKHENGQHVLAVNGAGNPPQQPVAGLADASAQQLEQQADRAKSEWLDS